MTSSLICLKFSPVRYETLSIALSQLGRSMRKFAPKAIFSMLVIRRNAADKPQWDRIALVVSITVTLALVALYAYGKATSRW